MNWVSRLEPDRVGEVLEQAIRTQAQVVLEIVGVKGATINGFIVSGDDQALLMEVTGRLPLSVGQLADASGEARLYMDKRYSFAARIRAVRKVGDTLSLALHRPTAVGLVERRRFQRARLAPSSRVVLRWEREGAAHQQVAVMLNVSVEGLACRLETAVATLIEPQTMLRVRFSLPGSNHRFDLPATLCNRTAASPGYTILGLHLSPGPEHAADVAELNRLLRQPQAVSTGVEVVA